MFTISNDINVPLSMSNVKILIIEKATNNNQTVELNIHPAGLFLYHKILAILTKKLMRIMDLLLMTITRIKLKLHGMDSLG